MRADRTRSAELLTSMIRLPAQVLDLLKHSSLYGLAALLGRIASLILLPVYTRYLSPEDYGVIAILDLTVSLLGIIIGSGIAAAVGRHHFETDDECQRNKLWTTGALMLMLSATLIVVPALIFRDTLAQLALGPEVMEGGALFALALATLWLTSFGQLSEHYLQVEKRSFLYFVFALCQLLTNISFNLYFLIQMEMGVSGILLGNLLTNAIFVCLRTDVVLRYRGGDGIDTNMIRPIMAFGLPLLVAWILGLAMHQADRFFLRSFSTLHEVGVYSLAYVIAQGVNSLVLTPFQMIWRIKAYEFSTQEGANEVYAMGFKWFLGGLLLLMFGLSLFSGPLIRIMASEQFAEAAALIPLLCLGYWFFSAATFFNLPMLIEKQTAAMIPASAIAVAVNFLTNFALVPRLGALGAAIATLVTFMTLASIACLVGRRIRRIEFPIPTVSTGVVVVLMSWLFWWRFVESNGNDLVSYASAALLWCVIFVAFLGVLLPSSRSS